MRYTFKVYERLKREQHINTLFLKGKAYSVFPLRLIYVITDRPDAKASPVMAGFSVPKKKFRKSVDRHRIRRLMVEAWRLNKHTLYPSVPEDKQMHLFVIFADNKMPDFDPVQKGMIKGIEKLRTFVAPDTTEGKNHEQTA